ncbi:hypothetical protein HYDPIDRAFT_30526, partial [Hydnomerulius pinastri MD-312]
MPSQSSLSADEKNLVKKALPDKVLTAVPGRVYFAHPQPTKWSYGGLQGALAFSRDESKGAFFLKLVDLTGSRGVIWQHELYDGFEYFQDRPYFHSFAGDECMIGFVFAGEKDAKLFHKKVTTRKADKVPKVAPAAKANKKGGKIDKSMISGPTAGSFKHVAHMGFDEEKGFTSTNVDPSWLAFLDGLKSQGVSDDLIKENMDFIKGFIRDAQQAEQTVVVKKKPPPPPARKVGHGPSSSVASTNGDSAPAPPPSRAPIPRPPPPQQPPRPTSVAPPPPPQRGSPPVPAPPARPPPPARTNVPPPPPTRPVSSTPPPPPPPPARTSNPPPAPPPAPP